MVPRGRDTGVGEENSGDEEGGEGVAHSPHYRILKHKDGDKGYYLRPKLLFLYEKKCNFG